MRVVAGLVKRGTYRDSVLLMRISRRLRDISGISQAEILVATESNLDALRQVNLLPRDVEEVRPRPSDLVVAVEGDAKAVESALRQADEMIEHGAFSHWTAGGADVSTKLDTGQRVVKSLRSALSSFPGANLALISVPGPYVRREAMNALTQGLNLLIFSSNVPLEDELALKQEAARRGLLVMGPDCGTAAFRGVALGFANAVRRGPVGLVGAAGTGLQEVSVLVHRAGSGVSHVIGAGSHDVDQRIGGESIIRGIDLLESDSSTRVLVIVGKPPHPETAGRILARVARLRKPSVVCFLGSPREPIASAGAAPADTLEDAAIQAVALAEGGSADDLRAAVNAGFAGSDGLSREAALRLAPSQRFVRALYSGGTLANEAAFIIAGLLGRVSGNVTLPGVQRLEDPQSSCGHTVIDLGDEALTRGRPHPMLEPGLREERLLKEAADPSVAAILLDFVLGYGGHPDPAGVSVAALRRARSVAEQHGRHLPIVTSVCGTDQDPQVFGRQVQLLTEAGVIISSTNARAARLTAQIVLQSRGEHPV